jgi:hypothetical protein
MHFGHRSANVPTRVMIQKRKSGKHKTKMGIPRSISTFSFQLSAFGFV